MASENGSSPANGSVSHGRGVTRSAFPPEKDDSTKAADPAGPVPPSDGADPHLSGIGSSTEFKYKTPDGKLDACPSLIGDYRVIEHLGSGGMGKVFSVQHVFFGRVEALKMLDERRVARGGHESFLTEMKTQADLDHSNIARVNYAGRIKSHDPKFNGRYYFVMSKESGDYNKYCEKDKLLPPAKAANVVRRVAKAIAHAHAQPVPVIHCDLKAKNILIGADDGPKVTDFGLVRLLAGSESQGGSTQPFGTLTHMPPEQARGEADERSDVYGLGAVLYELLTGRGPNAGPDPRKDSRQKLMARLADPHAKRIPVRQLNPKVPARLAAICEKCLQYDPDRRYQTADDVEAALDAFLRPPLWRRKWREGAMGAAFGCAVFASYFAFPDSRLTETMAKVTADEAKRPETAIDEKIKTYTNAIDIYKDEIGGNFYLTSRARAKGELSALEAKLGDLRRSEFEAERSKLAGVKANDVRDSIKAHETALARFQALTAESTAAADLKADASLAAMTAATKLAELLLVVRKFKEADDALHSAEKTYAERPRAADGTSPDGDFDLARAECHHIRGQYCYRLTKLPEAVQQFESGKRIRLALEGSRRGDPEFIKDLARSFGYLGDMQLALGKTREAEQSYGEAKTRRKMLADQFPTNIDYQCLHARDFDNFTRLNIHSAAADPGTVAFFDAAGRSDDVPERLVRWRDCNREHRDFYTARAGLKDVDTLPALYLIERINARLAWVRTDLALRGARAVPQVGNDIEAAIAEARWLALSSNHGEQANVRSGLVAALLVRATVDVLQSNPKAASARLNEADSVLKDLDCSATDGTRLAEPLDYVNWAIAAALLAEVADEAIEKLGLQVVALDRLEKAARLKFADAWVLRSENALRRLRAAHPKRFAEIEAQILKRGRDNRLAGQNQPDGAAAPPRP